MHMYFYPFRPWKQPNQTKPNPSHACVLGNPVQGEVNEVFSYSTSFPELLGMPIGRHLAFPGVIWL